MISYVGALSHMSTHKYFHAYVHVESPQLGHVSVLHHYPVNLQGIRRHPIQTICVVEAAHISLTASNLLWYTKSWLADTRLTDETLPILTSTSVDRHAQSQAINKVEGAASCVMTCRLTKPPTACRCDDCPVTTLQSSLQGLTQHYEAWLHVWTL